MKILLHFRVKFVPLRAFARRAAAAPQIVRKTSRVPRVNAATLVRCQIRAVLHAA